MSSIIDLVVTQSDDNPSISFVIVGDPIVQQRPKMTYKSRKFPIMYDPSRNEKIIFKNAIKQSLIVHGYNDFPFFKINHTDPFHSKGLYLNVTFYCNRCKDDYRIKSGMLLRKERVHVYPSKKDTDNMLKFVMDGFDNIIYDDDKCIVKITAEKKFIREEDMDKGGYTKVIITLI